MKQRGRPKLEELPTRQFILEAATLLFQEKGFKQISIEKICQRAGVSKMSFYRSFKDKIELFITIFTPLLKEELAWSKLLLLRKIPFRTKLDEMLKRRKENLLSPFTSLLQELYPTENPELHAFAEQMQRRIDRLNLRFLKMGQKENVISKNIKPAIFLLLIQKRNELILDPALIAIAPNFEERFLIVNEFFYFGLKGCNHEL
jgi:AcrR family transcriptional regulator